MQIVSKGVVNFQYLTNQQLNNKYLIILKEVKKKTTKKEQ